MGPVLTNLFEAFLPKVVAGKEGRKEEAEKEEP